jgi:hypothetical protein
MNDAEELIVREWIVGRVAAATTLARIVPAPIVFVDKADYLATHLGLTAPTTAKAIVQSHVAAAWIYLKGATDDPTTPAHSPLTTWPYECYLFSEASLERADESLVGPDDFLKLTLRRHNEFVANFVNLKEALQGEINIPGLTGYATAKTLPVKVREEIQHDTDCEFVRGVRGDSVRLGLEVWLQKEAC